MSLRDGSKFKVQSSKFKARSAKFFLHFATKAAKPSARRGAPVLSPLGYESEQTGGKLDGVQ
jgi:hypothetical protein